MSHQNFQSQNAQFQRNNNSEVSSTPSTPAKNKSVSHSTSDIRSPSIAILDFDAGAANKIPNLKYPSYNSNSNLVDSFEHLPMTSEAPPITPTHSNFDPHIRRYSYTNTNSSPQVSNVRTISANRARPRSAIFLDSPITEDDVLSDSSTYSNTPRNRNSYSFAPTRNYLPPPSMPPPRSNPPSRSSSPSRSRSHIRAKSPVRTTSPSRNQPFNFKSTELMMHSNNSANSLTVKPAHRKGHRYKHSSVSMNLFQEPVQKAPLKIPASLPIPTFGEFLGSMSPTQKIRLSWSLFHLFTAVFVFYMGFKYSLNNLSTLSHLVFYDAIGTMAVVSVDIMSNFDVWSSSSIKHPFGLGRIEVLVGFALSASLMMVGGDLISHTLEEFIISFVMSHHEGSHSHHVHSSSSSTDVDWFHYEMTLILSIIVTLISSNILYSETINTLIRKQNYKLIANTIIKNPTHLLTLFFASYLTFYPIIINIDSIYEINEISTIIIALLIIGAGWKLVKSLGCILLLSYPYDEKNFNHLISLIDKEITHLDAFKSYYKLSNLFIAKFNYKLFVIGMKVSIKNDSDDDEYRLRFEINRLVQRLMKENNEGYNDKIEITIDVDRD